MTEFNGNPESGVDQLLNKSIELPTDAPTDPVNLALASYKAQANNLQEEVYKLNRIIDKAKASIEEVLDGDVDAQGTFDAFEEAFTLLGVEMTEEQTYSLTASWEITLMVPRGEVVTAEDFTVSDFETHYEVTRQDWSPTIDVDSY